MTPDDQPDHPSDDRPKRVVVPDPDDLLEKALEEEGIAPETRHAVTFAFRRFFSGPMPPPEVLAAYEKIAPGTASQIFQMAERESRHRQDLERIQISGAERRMNRGQAFGFLVAAISIAAAVGTIWLVPSVVGSIVATIIVVAGVGGPAAARLLASRVHVPTTENDSRLAQ